MNLMMQFMISIMSWASLNLTFFWLPNGPPMLFSLPSFHKSLESFLIFLPTHSFQGLLSFPVPSNAQACSSVHPPSFIFSERDHFLSFKMKSSVFLCESPVWLYFFLSLKKKNPICINYRVLLKFLKIPEALPSI